MRDVAFQVSRETLRDLERLSQLILSWNQRINLVGDTRDFWHRHILDSAQLVPLAADATRWLDLGSGAGLPGLVVATFLKHKTGGIELIESNGKKAAFLRSAAVNLDLPAVVHLSRIESAKLLHRPEVVTARALAPLTRLLELAHPYLARGARGLFHKGQNLAEELETARESWHMAFREHPSLIDDGGVILEVSKADPKG